ncbi:sigma factor-like helix-turn-helix DNA-binding protein [Myxococcus faecalis]|uniref:sigma factor-like helix-turn-helix DNA-binding protein n=1 Tax=Myxococcus faecalis TaxID=3115646 RepID=UPI003CF7EB0B
MRWDAPGTLSVSDREALRLRDLEGLFAEEAARSSGIDVPAHQRRLHRARASESSAPASLLSGIE